MTEESPLEQNSSEELGPIEEFIQKVVAVCDRLPIGIKHLVLHPDVLMVLKGLKAGTNYSFLEDTFQESEFEEFKEGLKSFGVRVSPPVMVDSSSYSRRMGFIYNPTTLEHETENSTMVPPYHSSDEIDDYLARSIVTGYNQDAVMGKIFSFPESAIKDFLENVAGEREVMAHYNETYTYSPPAKPDILEREQKKSAFFDVLRKSPTYKALEGSGSIQESRHLWHERLPERIRNSGNR